MSHSAQPIDIADLNAKFGDEGLIHAALNKEPVAKEAKQLLHGGSATITPQYWQSPTQYNLDANLQADFPKLQVDANSSSMPNAVDTSSLKSFADWIENTILPPVQKLRSDVQDVLVQPGTLPAGTSLAQKVMGGNEADGGAPGGLKAGHLTVLNSLDAGMKKLAEDIRALGAKFDNADDLNKATASDLQDVMGDLGGLGSGLGGVSSASIDPVGTSSGNSGSSSSTGSGSTGSSSGTGSTSNSGTSGTSGSSSSATAAGGTGTGGSSAPPPSSGSSASTSSVSATT